VASGLATSNARKSSHTEMLGAFSRSWRRDFPKDLLSLEQRQACRKTKNTASFPHPEDHRYEKGFTVLEWTKAASFPDPVYVFENSRMVRSFKMNSRLMRYKAGVRRHAISLKDKFPGSKKFAIVHFCRLRNFTQALSF